MRLKCFEGMPGCIESVDDFGDGEARDKLTNQHKI